MPKHKTEIAKGLLLEPDLHLNGAALKGVAIGETGWMKRGAGNVSWTSRILPDELGSLKAPAASAFESNMIGHFRYVVLDEDKEEYLTTGKQAPDQDKPITFENIGRSRQISLKNTGAKVGLSLGTWIKSVAERMEEQRKDLRLLSGEINTRPIR